jgi:hypothetical protein
MVQRSTEILPEGCVWAGVVRGEEQREHEENSEQASGAHEDSRHKRQADGQFAVGHQKGDRGGMGKNEIAKDGNHEGIGALGEKAVDPELKATAESELRAEDFVLGEEQKE